MLSINFLKFKDCPTAPKALEKLRSLLERESVEADVNVIDINNKEDANYYRFLGSPTIQINGYDIETKRRGDKPAYGCRIYRTMNGPSGVPDEYLIIDSIKRANNPRCKILFLCTGNSCRSQMAEGWTHHLWGDTFYVYSAGIETHGLNPNAVKVMAEAGVDISTYKSKNVNDLLHIPFDFVITVCGHAYENCPYFSGKAKVLHIGFDDPPKLVADAKTEEEVLGHYGRVRDEIKAYVETLPEFFSSYEIEN